tara:strand:+ start:1264 stop:3234 length:1971 start_codon:yes stop_codon:yes gene_type:complete
MCGIAGFIDFGNELSEANLGTLTKMTDALTHRGPDSDGMWSDQDNRVYFGHRRLAILDLSSMGHQPMTSHCGRYVICYNGEIYNHLTLKKKIENLGSAFKGNSDTETLLEAISFLGLEETLKLIKGMFAFALWDKKTKNLTLVRDHLGKKPMYFGFSDNKLYFCSELKAAFALFKKKPEIDRDAFNQYIKFGYISAPHCIYKNSYKLKPAHSITFNLQERNKQYNQNIINRMIPYWSVQDVRCNQSTQEPENIQETLKSLLGQAVKERMLSDVPIGSFLSGGIDSSLITALMQEQSPKPIRTYTIGFEDEDFNEAGYAKAVAKHLGTEHQSHIVTSEEARSIIPDLCEIYDEPFSDISQIPTYHVCKMAKQEATVVLSGDGGDEIFCGYSRYFMAQTLFDNIKSKPLFLRRFLGGALSSCSAQSLDRVCSALSVIKSLEQHNLSGKRLHSIGRYLNSRSLDELVEKVMTVYQAPERLTGYAGISGDVFSRKDIRPEISNSFDRMMISDILMYLTDDILVKVDRASMANSLEVRSPLLDIDLMEWAMNIPVKQKVFNDQNRGKKPLYDLLQDYVPKDLIDRPKQGFSVPIARWLRGPLNDWANDLLSKQALDQTSLYDSDEVMKIWSRFQAGKIETAEIIWSILMAQAWYRRWLIPS